VEALIGQAYARYFGATNVISLLLQLFVVSRVVKHWECPSASDPALYRAPVLQRPGLLPYALGSAVGEDR